MKDFRSYFSICLLVGGLLLNSAPVQAFFVYGAGIQVSYSTTLNSKKDMRNLLLFLGGITALGFFTFWALGKIEKYNNRPPAPRPANPQAPAVVPALEIAKEQELQEIRKHKTYCANTYTLYEDLNGILQKQRVQGQLGAFSPEVQKKYVDDMREADFIILAHTHFNAQKQPVADYQKKLADDIAKLNQNIVHIGQIQGSIPPRLVADFDRERDEAEKLKTKLALLVRYIRDRKPHLQLYQQVDRIEKHSGWLLNSIACNTDISDITKRDDMFPHATFKTRQDYVQAVIVDARTLPVALNSVLGADRTVTPDLYNKAYTMNPNLQILARELDPAYT